MAMISYVPPGVYTETKFQPPLPVPPGIFRTPLFIGTGNEELSKTVQLVRGSTAGSLQVGEEYVTNSFVYADPTNPDAVIPRQAADGTFRVFKVQYSPIVRNDGTQDITDSRSDVSVTVNGVPAVVEAVDGLRGLVKLVDAPMPGDEVRCSYRFARSDTQIVKEDLTAQISNLYHLVLPLKFGASSNLLLSNLSKVTVGNTDYVPMSADLLLRWVKAKTEGTLTTPAVTDGNLVKVSVSGSGVKFESNDIAWTLDSATPLSVSGLTSGLTSGLVVGSGPTLGIITPNASVPVGTNVKITVNLNSVANPTTTKTVEIPVFAVDTTLTAKTSQIAQLIQYFGLLSTEASIITATQVSVDADGEGSGTADDSYVLLESTEKLTVEGSKNTETYSGTSADKANTVYYTNNSPLRNGLSDGRLASGGDVKIYVNGSITPLVNSNPAAPLYTFEATTGEIKLEEALFTELTNNSESLTQLQVDYFFNQYGDFWDFLPDAGVNQIISCGRLSTKNEYVDGEDFVLGSQSNNLDRLYWGNAATVKENLFSGQSVDILTSKTSSYVPFDSRQVTAGLLEYKTYLEEASVTNNPFVYTLSTMATLGDNSSTSVADNTAVFPGTDPNVLLAYKGTSVTGTLTPVIVAKAEVSSGGKLQLTLQSPLNAGLGEKLFVTYNYAKFRDMTYVLEKQNLEYYNVYYSADGVSVDKVSTVTTPVLSTDSGQTLSFLDRTARLSPKFDYSGSSSTMLKDGLYGIKFDAGSKVNFSFCPVKEGSSGYEIVKDNNNVDISYKKGVAGQSFTYCNLTFAVPQSAANGSLYVFAITPDFQVGIKHSAAVAGVDLQVSDLLNVKEKDSALLTTYEKSGKEPPLGSIYWVTYLYDKKNFSTKIFSKLSDVVTEYGPATPDYPVSLAASLAFANGAGTVAIKQVKKDPGLKTASMSKYVQAIKDIEGTMDNGFSPAYVVPLVGATPDLLKLVSDHCDEQSSVLYRAERNSLFGVPAGVLPEVVGPMAEEVLSSRVRMVYPDSLLLTTVSSFGKKTQHLVDGFYMAAAVAGRVCAKGTDAATPWDRKPILGFDGLARKMNRVQMDNVAKYGITVIEQGVNGLFIRHGLTTDTSNVLTRNPTVTQIVDEIHLRARTTLDPFIGMKFVPSIVTDISEKFTGMLNNAKAQQIIKDYKEVVVVSSEDDPQAVDISVFIAPVLPLLYINVKFTMRVSL